MQVPIVRVRITRPRHGEIDGVALDTLQVGETYDLPATLGTYLVITSSAVPVETAGARYFPFETRIDVSPAMRSVANDQKRPRRSRRAK
jgi:hypothetical protein